jgi:hypothetical protein
VLFHAHRPLPLADGPRAGPAAVIDTAGKVDHDTISAHTERGGGQLEIHGGLSPLNGGDAMIMYSLGRYLVLARIS